MPASSPDGSMPLRKVRFSSAIVRRVHFALIAAPRAHSSLPSAPVAARSWLPARQIAARPRASATQASGSAPYPTRSPRHQSSSAPSASAAAMTAWKACLLPWMSDAMATRMRGVIVYSVLKRLRLPVTVIAALAVAEVAVFLMRPRDRLEPVDVAAQTYFSPAFVHRAEDFRTGQLWLYGARLAIELGVLVYLVRRPPRGSYRRPVLAGAAVAAGLAVAVTVATLPVSAIARERAKGVGLVTQSWTGWIGDVVKSTAIEAVIVGAGGAILVFAIR